MSIDRRHFLKVGGLTVIGLAGGSVAKVFSQDDSLQQIAPEELKPTGPLTAKRWAMVVDVRKCLEHEDCTECITACHTTHNVPTFESPKDEIKWIWKEHYEHAFHDQKHEYQTEDMKHKPILVMCNHCDNPPCVRVCPTQATWRREEDGIVMMDWHRCIGCRYCVAACPYGSRSFNWRDPRPHIEQTVPDFPTRMRGVVEKCTFCEERLARGLMPACVEACPHGALHFGDLEDPHSVVRELLNEHYSLRRKPELGTKPEVFYLV